ncbi:MauE/DoxX family redox-associated membrane protein [Dyadobacter sp. CY356]|uniref:MauE/DoxX family redox-associated membrane protein n=1 Tax=Dyadobacter sp. CY356 TaxID=2906442 RepID=UPI001F39E081|nr:MauE/DoxX family redox-associated membrane protein [Dyadobacter sp. CY356]MCF0055091.1 hypothetical protein [Dyadobacter sp. CY356]
MKTNLLRMITAMLILLFVYTAVAKLSNLSTFESELMNQAVPKVWVPYLLWLIPLSEALVVLMLCTKKTRRTGFYGSALLMSVFTGYMGLVLLNAFERVPCSCGGVLKHMSFGVHFVFNLVLLLVSVTGIWMLKSGNADQQTG